MGILKSLAVYVFGWLTGAQNAGPGPLTIDDLVPIVSTIRQALSALDTVFTTAGASFADGVGYARGVGNQIDEMGADIKSITEHTYNVVIPGSMSWLRGYMILHIIDPIRAQIAIINHNIKDILHTIDLIDGYLNKVVKPELALWMNFRTWFFTWPRQVLGILQDWLQHPAHFATWSVPIVARPLLTYIASSDHKELRDQYAYTMVNAWSEEPDLVWQQLEDWLLAGK